MSCYFIVSISMFENLLQVGDEYYGLHDVKGTTNMYLYNKK